jgi:hypothetical protein
MSDLLMSEELLKKLCAAFSSLPCSVLYVSDDDTSLGKSLTNNSDDVDVEYGCFNAGLIRVFGTPEAGLTFPDSESQARSVSE